jgi:hypothetical protein
MWVLFREFLVNLGASAIGELSSPSGMMSYAVVLGFMILAVVSWHQKRVAKDKRGMDSWYFIALSSTVAVVAIFAAAYGVGLRASKPLEVPGQSLQQQPLAFQPNIHKSPFEELAALNAHLSAGDRERLSNALFDFSQVLDQANKVFGAMNSAGAKLNNAWQDGSVAKDSESHKARLLAAQTLAKEFEANFSGQREKWKYYQSDIAYVFGSDPDNNALQARNGIDDYLNFLDRWTKIENKNETPILQLMWHAQLRFDGYLHGFSNWKNESVARLDQVKKSLQ